MRITAKDKQLHDALDQAVLDAYGWRDLSDLSDASDQSDRSDQSDKSNKSDLPATARPQSGSGVPPLADRLAANTPAAEALEQQLLARLAALNHERAADLATAIPALAARLAGRTTPKRRAQLQAILETLQTLGHG